MCDHRGTLIAIKNPEIRLQGPKVPEAFATTSGRPWLIDIFAVPFWVVVSAIVPAVMATILLLLDAQESVDETTSRSMGGDVHA